MKLENLVYGLVDIELEVNEHGGSNSVRKRLIESCLSLCIDNGYPEIVDLDTDPELVKEFTNQIRMMVTSNQMNFFSEEFKMLTDEEAIIEYNHFADAKENSSVIYSIHEVSSDGYFIQRELKSFILF
ncbi:hypothetical protein AV650_25770 [Serratia fonticola]|nr:hypothetical protein AV650_25770 [Serratia fonticola]